MRRGAHFSTPSFPCFLVVMCGSQMSLTTATLSAATAMPIAGGTRPGSALPMSDPYDTLTLTSMKGTPYSAPCGTPKPLPMPTCGQTVAITLRTLGPMLRPMRIPSPLRGGVLMRTMATMVVRTLLWRVISLGGTLRRPPKGHPGRWPVTPYVKNVRHWVVLT